ncbi:hypothetical protein AVEN_1153-1 [Araneus ventricosus]|uniref:Uncharacterized protein n=1 Tax=Araneus ventricosus TaxID=182803 RepID=A0A4Y2QLS6_ARAVE|nr:hypothetical protein AVEN_1153-1 [Araneus ventricosus]
MSKQGSSKFEIFGHGGVLGLSCRSIKSQMCSIGLRSCDLGDQDIKWNSSVCSSNHSNKSEPCDMGRVLLEDSISSWEDKRHIRVQLIRNDVQIVCNFHGLFDHNYGSQRGP